MKKQVLYYARQNGMLLMSAIFVLLVLAALGAAGVTVVQSADRGYNSALAQERAYWAAREGLEWAAFQAKAYQSCNTPTLGNVGGNASADPTLPHALGGFNRGYQVTCTSVDGEENGHTIRIMYFVSTGYLSGATPASRTLQSSVIVVCEGVCPT